MNNSVTTFTGTCDSNEIALSYMCFQSFYLSSPWALIMAVFIAFDLKIIYNFSQHSSGRWISDSTATLGTRIIAYHGDT